MLGWGSAAFCGRPRGRLTWLTAVCVALSAFGAPAYGQVSPEALVKSARIFTLAKFVYWPTANQSEAAAPLLFCVTAEPTLAIAFAAMAGRRIAGRLIRIEEIRPAGAARCQLLYVGSDRQARAAVLQAIGSAPVLTITTGADRAEPGFAISLLPQGSDFAPTIDRTALSGAGLSVAGDLLQLVTDRAPKRAVEQ